MQISQTLDVWSKKFHRFGVRFGMFPDSGTNISETKLTCPPLEDVPIGASLMLPIYLWSGERSCTYQPCPKINLGSLSYHISGTQIVDDSNWLNHQSPVCLWSFNFNTITSTKPNAQKSFNHIINNVQNRLVENRISRSWVLTFHTWKGRRILESSPPNRHQISQIVIAPIG